MAAKTLRFYHLILSVLAILAYIYTHPRDLHAWLGYAVVAAIVFRFAWSMRDDPWFRLSRLKPSFEGLNFKNALAHPGTGKLITLIVFVSLIGAAATGVALDKGRTLGFADRPALQSEEVRPAGEATPRRERREQHERRHQPSALKEAHEVFANIFIVFAVLHMVHMFAYRRPMAKFMLFLKKK